MKYYGVWLFEYDLFDETEEARYSSVIVKREEAEGVVLVVWFAKSFILLRNRSRRDCEMQGIFLCAVHERVSAFKDCFGEFEWPLRDWNFSDAMCPGVCEKELVVEMLWSAMELSAALQKW